MNLFIGRGSYIIHSTDRLTSVAAMRHLKYCSEAILVSGARQGTPRGLAPFLRSMNCEGTSVPPIGPRVPRCQRRPKVLCPRCQKVLCSRCQSAKKVPCQRCQRCQKCAVPKVPKGARCHRRLSLKPGRRDLAGMVFKKLHYAIRADFFYCPSLIDHPFAQLSHSHKSFPPPIPPMCIRLPPSTLG